MTKRLTYLAVADATGLLLGGRVPIILSRRADRLRARASVRSLPKVA
jgi:hypothetical protein